MPMSSSRSILDRVRSRTFAGLSGPVGDGIAPVRLSKELLRRANVVLGQPLCSSEVLESRRAAEAKLVELRSARQRGDVARASRTTAQAPVTVYFEKDRNARELGRIKEALGTKKITFTCLDVAGDENTLAFVLRTAGVKSDELPVVFVGDKAIGGLAALVDADVSGRLEGELYPT